MKSVFVILLLLTVLPQLHAQQTLPVTVVQRMYISDPDLSSNQSFYYRRKEEFHQVLVYDLGEHSGKKAPVDFYVDFLATREKAVPVFLVSIKWKQLVFFNGQTEVRSVTLPNSRTQRLENGISTTVPEIQNEYRYIYPVRAVLEIQVFRVNEKGNKILLSISEPIQHNYSTQFKATQRAGQWVKPAAAPNPDKPMIFKELLATHYEDIKKTMIDYFNSSEFDMVLRGN